MRHTSQYAFMLVLPGFLLAGCATEEFRYVPTEHQAPIAQRKDEAVYSAPADSPTATIRIVSMGISDLKDPLDSTSAKTLHLRMSVSNKRDAGNWVFNSQDQSVSFPDQPLVPPMTVKSGTQETPQFTIKPEELRSIDLYFPLPKEVASAQDLPEFDFHWQLKSGTQIIHETTLFDRVRSPESPPPYSYAYGWGSPWNWDGPMSFGGGIY